jgi:hypothetical protein
MVYWISPLKMGLSEKKVREEINKAYSEEKWESIDCRSTKEVKANIEPPLTVFETTWKLTEKIKPELEPGQKRRPKGSIKTIDIDVRCVFYRHEQNAKKEKEKREVERELLEKALGDFSSKLNKCKYKELEYCKKKFSDVVNPFSRIKRFLQYDLSQLEDGSISLTWSWDEATIEEETKYDGIFALLTNYTKEQVNGNGLITSYRGMGQIEVNFKDMKGILDLERVLHQKPERIDTYIFLKVIALYVLAFMRCYAQSEGVKTTEKEIQENMGNMLITETTLEPLERKSYGVARDTDLNKLFRKKFSLPDPYDLIRVLNEAERSKMKDYIQTWYDVWLEANCFSLF